jgi:hypothetical protein
MTTSFDRAATFCRDLPDIFSANDQADRRVHQRYLTTLRVAKLTSASRQTLGIVRNISSGGMMIDLCMIYNSTPVDVGDTLGVSLHDADILPGKILWRNGPVFGLQFDHAIDVADVISKPTDRAKGKVPRKPRVTAHAPVSIATADSNLETWLFDISQNGLKVPADPGLRVAQKIVISIDDLGTFPASVRWMSADYAGLFFASELPLRELISWLARQTFSGDRAEGNHLT